jgi:hypothetical protein
MPNLLLPKLFGKQPWLQEDVRSILDVFGYDKPKITSV